MYVEDDSGRRIPCPHPCEWETVIKVLGKNASKDLVKERIGYNSDCVCLDCLRFSQLDLGDDEKTCLSWRYYYGAVRQKDQRRCPHCGSPNVKTVVELVDQPCPRCKEGIIRPISTGIMS